MWINDDGTHFAFVFEPIAFEKVRKTYIWKCLAIINVSDPAHCDLLFCVLTKQTDC